MISVEQALKKIENTVKVSTPIQKALAESFGLVLAEDVLSPIDMPPFPQSAMDGYAVALNGSNIFTLVGEVKAGDGKQGLVLLKLRWILPKRILIYCKLR